MRVILRTSVVAALAALTIFVSMYSASADPWHRHWGGGYGYGAGALGAGLAIGLLGAAIATDVAVHSCYVNQPVYDRYGRVIGYRTVNTCY